MSTAACVVPSAEFVSSADYAKALMSQGACNMSGLVHALDQVITKICNEAHATRRGTEFVNQHPIVRLYVEQMMHLARGRDWSRAYKICTTLAGEGR